MRRGNGWAAAILAMAILGAGQLLFAAPHRLRQRTANRRALPAYRYGFDDVRAAGNLVAIASVDQPAPVAGLKFGPPKDAPAVKRKVFAAPLPALVVDRLQLSRISLAIYDSGQIVATGLLRHDGGPYGSIQGNNVTIRLRAFAGTPQFAGELNGAPMLWQTERQLWISRNRPQMISLIPLPGDLAGKNAAIPFHVPAECSFDELLRRHFNEITHLEIELEYRHDR
jgi:hypothetical protein